MEVYTPLTKEELEEQKQSTKKVLINAYQMYEKSIAEMLKVRKEKKDKQGNPIYPEKDTEKTLKLMKTMQQDVVDKFVNLGGTEEELKASLKGKKKNIDRSALENIMKKNEEKEEMAKYLSQMKDLKFNKPVEIDKDKTSDELENYIANGKEEEEIINMSVPQSEPVKDIDVTTPEPVNDALFTDMKQCVNGKEMFGIVKLPSNGECYKNKIKELRVSYLTAYDENMIFSPNLYKEGEFLEYIAKRKVLDNIDVNDLVQGDIEAIIIWLRGTGYGNEYPIIVTDPETGKEFETNVDLTQLKYRDFKLKGDEDGYFDFVTPNTHDTIKFKILTNRDEKFLKKLKIKESNKVKVMMLRKYSDELLNAISGNDLIDSETQEKVKKEVEDVHNEIVSKYDEASDFSFTHELTDRLKLQTISVNGIKDRNYISDYIVNMNIKDASEYRKFIIQNTPGIDYNVKVERPMSLGGGSVDTFLRFDQFIFINI